MGIVSGIYKIVNTKDGKFYIGSSKNLDCRKNRHFSELKRGKHCNSFLQNVWNKYGEGIFSFEILLIMNNPTKEDLLIMEEKFFIEFSPEYNLGSLSGGKYIGKHLKSNKKSCADCGAKISETSVLCFKCVNKGERHPNFGKPRKQETIEKIKNKRLSLPEEIRCQPHSNQTKEKMSKTRREKRSKAVNQIDPTTNEIVKTWNSIVEAVESLRGSKHLSSQTGISRVCAKTIQPSGSICQIALGFKWEWAWAI